MPALNPRQFRQSLAAHEEHVSAGSGDVNPLMGSTFGTGPSVTAWRVSHKGERPQPIRADNFSTTMFNPSKEWSPVKAR